MAHRYGGQRMDFKVAIGVAADIEGLAGLGVSAENDPVRKSGGQFCCEHASFFKDMVGCDPRPEGST